MDLPPAGAEWKAALKTAMSAHRVLLAHPWSAALVLDGRRQARPGPERGPNAVELVLAALGFCYGVGYVANAAIQTPGRVR
jgi:hypothetical protein